MSPTPTTARRAGFVAVALLLACMRYFGFDLTNFFRRDSNPNTPKR